MEGTPRQSSSAPSPLRLRDECFRVPDEGEIPRSKFETSPLSSTSCSRPASLNSTCQMSEEAASSNSADADAPEEEVHASKSAIVYVKNLPCKVGCQRMMLELKALGLDGCYDFLHFPTKPSHGKETCVGYGFIHFTRDDYASYFMSMFENHYFDDIRSEKVVRVELAREQDFMAKLAECRRALSKKPASCMFDPAGLRAPLS